MNSMLRCQTYPKKQMALFINRALQIQARMKIVDEFLHDLQDRVFAYYIYFVSGIFKGNVSISVEIKVLDLSYFFLQ